MPKIATYDAPDNLGLRPTETGINAVAAAARRVQGEYNEAAASQERIGTMLGRDVAAIGEVAVKYAEHREISAGAANFATLQNGLQRAWDETAKRADPNDPTIATRFNEEVVEPALAQYGQGFLTDGGQKFAESHVASLRQHMFTKTSSDMSALAGEAAKINFRQTTNALSNTVRSDPASLDFSLKTLDSSVGAMIDSSPNLTGAQAAKVRGELLQHSKEEVIKNAALGHIEKTGEVPDWVSDPKYAPYVKGDELKQFANAAKFYDRANRSEQRSQRQQADYEAKQDFNVKVNELRLQTMPQDVGGRPVLPPDYWQKVRDLGSHPGAALEPGLLKSLMHEGDAITNRLNKPEPLSAISQRTTIDLLRRMRATDDSRIEDSAPIYEAYDDGRLSTRDFNFLQRELQATNTPEGRALRATRNDFFKRYAIQIDPTMGVGGLEGEKMYQAEQDARRLEGDLRKAGKDPNLVYQPGSEYFFGRPENLQKYRPTMQEKTEYDARQKELRTRQGTTAAPIPTAPSPSPAFVPPRDWRWNPARRQYMDPNGTIYDASGKRVH